MFKKFIEEKINEVFELAADGKTAVIENRGVEFPSDKSEYMVEVALNLAEKDKAPTISKCTALYTEIEDIAKADSKSNADNPIWDKYIKPFSEKIDIGNFEEEGTIAFKVDFEEELSDEELRIYNEYKADRDSQARARLGDNSHALGLINRSQRVCKLLEIGAPESIILKELSPWVIEYLLFNWGTTYGNNK